MPKYDPLSGIAPAETTPKLAFSRPSGLVAASKRPKASRTGGKSNNPTGPAVILSNGSSNPCHCSHVVASGPAGRDIPSFLLGI